MKLKTIETIFKICVLISLISVIFDISVTYTFYKKDAHNFLTMEAQRNLVGELKEGIPFFKTITIKFVFLTPILLFFIISSIKLFHKKAYKISLFIVSPLLLMGSVTHILGGLSWL